MGGKIIHNHIYVKKKNTHTVRYDCLPTKQVKLFEILSHKGHQTKGNFTHQCSVSWYNYSGKELSSPSKIKCACILYDPASPHLGLYI